MRRISEVLRLSAEGLSVGQVARSVGLSKSTVHGYLERARGAGLCWPLPAELDAGELEGKLFSKAAEPVHGRPEPDWRQVHRELKRGRHVTLRLLWLEWRTVNPQGWGYTQFCVHYRRWLGSQELVMRMEYGAGERLFVDYSGDTMPVVDAETGEIAQAQVFVSVLGASGLLYVEATRGQDLRSWLEVHGNAFEFYGGVPAIVVPDNLKSGVTKACWYEPEVNRSYLELARHYGTVILPTRTARPQDKAAVEVGVQVAERWVLAPLRKHRFFSLAELNAALAENTAGVNGRPFRGQPGSRRDLFEEIERQALKPLPVTRYEFADWKNAKLNIDYHVEFDHRCYSAPYQLVRQAVEVRATVSVVEIFHQGRRVASHRREYGRRRFITDPAHMPASHRAHAEWSPSRLVDWAASIGPQVAEVADTILRTRPHPEHGYRACLGLMRLAKRYGTERLCAACQRALVINGLSYRSVESILKSGLDRTPLPAPQLTLVAPVEHHNLRGPDYYRKEA